MAPKEFTCEVVSIEWFNPTLFRLFFNTDAPFEFIAGQFISIAVPGGKTVRRAYSIASAPHVRPVELCIKVVEGGPGTSYLKELKPGDKFRGTAPHGKFIFQNKRPDTCFIATGTGIAPFRSMIHSEGFKKSPPRKTLCLFGVRFDDELTYQNEWNDSPEVQFIPAISKASPNWNGFRGRVTDVLRTQGDQLLNWNETDFYLCGAGPMITEVKQILAEKGVSKDAIHQEVYFV